MINPTVDAAFSRSRTVLSILTLLLIVGLFSYINIPKESSPDIDIPMIYVSMHLDGISPDDAEQLLVRPMEQELTTIEGVEEMKSSAYQGGANVMLEFNAGFDKDVALTDVRTAVDKAKADLPADADEPTVNEINFSLFPVLVVTLTGDVPERTLLKLARDLQDRIESITSVLEAGIAGDREELVEILIDPTSLESYGLVGGDIVNFFNASNRLVAAGSMDTGAGSFAIEVPGLFEDVRDIVTMPLTVSGDSALTVRDIADIRQTFKDPQSFARLNGEKSIALEIVKRSGENIIDTIEAVREIVKEEQKNWPASVKVYFTQDRSTDIRNMLTDLQNNVISAILLVMIIVVWALGVRAATLVGISIPGSFLSGILIIYIMGLTVNIVVLFSLILSVGMLVDGAIVVIEYADRKMAEGLNKTQAYKEASKRMAWPIIASTATTLVAFAPLLYWPDVVGEFMSYMPITLISVLGASLFMALIFIPVLGGLIGKPAYGENSEEMQQLQIAETGDLKEIKGFSRFYLNVLELAVDRPFMVLGACIILLFGVSGLYGAVGKGVEFFPETEPEQASVLVHARGNLSIYEQDKIVKEVEQRIFGTKGIETVYTRVGASAQQGSDLAEDVIAQIQVEFLDWDERRKVDVILQEILDKTSDLGGIFIETSKAQEGPPTGKDIQIELSSRYPEKLKPVADVIIDGIKTIGQTTDLEDSRPLPGIDWELKVDRAQAAKFGLDITTIGQYVRMVTNGLIIADYRPDDAEDEVDIVIRHYPEQRTLDQLNHIRIESPSGGSIPISSFVSKEHKRSVGVINRVDQRRIITIKANVEPGLNVDAKVKEFKQWLEDNKDRLDPDVRLTFRGADEDQKESQEFLGSAFMIALALMAVILVTQFNSFYSAFLILTAVIMSTVGVMIGLMVTQQPFGIIMSGVGVIALAGIIVNNNIVLIDTFDTLKRDYGPETERNMDTRELVLRTGVQRLRPVLLTTITTIIGLMPMVLQTNIDFLTREVSIGAPSTQMWVQLATAIASGLTFSTMLTLIVTPSALMMRDKAHALRVWLLSKIIKTQK